MVSDQADTEYASPHDGRGQRSLSPSIVGLMRNSLSEATRTSQVVAYTLYVA